MIAASYNRSNVCVICHVLCLAPSFVNDVNYAVIKITNYFFHLVHSHKISNVLNLIN